MLLKMFKYDMKRVSLSLIILHVSLFVLMFGTFVFQNISDFVSGLLAFIFMILLLVTQLAVHIQFIKRFKARMFEKEAYIYRSLPVSVDGAMLSHMLGYVVWGLINQVISLGIIVSVGFLFDSSGLSLASFNEALSHVQIVPWQFWTLTVVGMVLEFVWFATWSQVATAVANFFPSHDRIVLILEYIVCFFVLLYGWLWGSMWHFSGMHHTSSGDVMSYGLILCLVALGLSLINYFVARWIITKHTDVA